MQVTKLRVLLLGTVTAMIAVSYCLRTYAAEISPNITEREASELVTAIADHNRAPGTSYVVYKTHNPDFLHCCYQFEIRSKDPRSVDFSPLGYPLISKRTADVWDSVREKRYDFPELRRLQARIRKRHGITQTRDPGLEEALGVTQK